MPPLLVDQELNTRLTRLSRVHHAVLSRHASSILKDLQQGKATSRGTFGDGHYLKTPSGCFELHKAGHRLILTSHGQAKRTVFTLGLLGLVNVKVL